MKSWTFELYDSRRQIVEVKSYWKKKLECDLLLCMAILYKNVIVLLFSEGGLRLGDSS